MSTLHWQLDPRPRADPSNFSIILGGPLYQLLRRAHMTDDAMALLRRRVLVLALFAWLPLVVLSAIAGDAWGGSAAVPFLKDIQAHARFLVALPLLVLAEMIVHQRLLPVANEFVNRHLVPDDAVGRFDAALDAAMRLRNSVSAELLMIVLIYAVGVPVLWRETSVLDVTTWYANPADGGARLKLAGIWYAYVSIPLFQFLLLRWYFRLIVWTRFLWQVSRIDLNLSAMHADRMGGLGFLAGTVFAFVPLVMAHGALLAGTIANRIFYAGAQLADAKYEIAIVLAVLFVLVFGPITVFTPQLAAAKRTAARLYGRLAQRYVHDFEAAWLPNGMPPSQSPLGTGDIQSLADMGNSFETLRGMRVFPITRDAVVQLGVATLVPIAPLLLTVIPAEEIAKRLLGMLL